MGDTPDPTTAKLQEYGLTAQTLADCEKKRLSYPSDEEFKFAALLFLGVTPKESFELAWPEDKGASPQKIQTKQRLKNVAMQMAAFHADPCNIPGPPMPKEEFLGILARHARPDQSELSEAGQLKSLEMLGRASGYFKDLPPQTENAENPMKKIVGRIIENNNSILPDTDDEDLD